MPTILVADDDTDLRETYELWLDEREGWSVRSAADGAEARDRLDETVDVALLDRQMPKVPGREVAASIREDHPDCDVIFVSAFEPGDVDDSTYDRYLVKPVAVAELTTAIESQIGNQPTVTR